jgi:hypothetical protein
MSENLSHHYIPQFYFRMFSEGKNCICCFIPKTYQSIPQASIKGQCASHKLYGSKEIEAEFCKLEDQHAKCLRSIMRACINKDASQLTRGDFANLMSAIVFQRARTMLEVEKVSPAMDELALKMFAGHLKHTLPSEEKSKLLGPIERGEVTISRSATTSVLMHINSAMQSAAFLSDMRPILLINDTDRPFIFSDSPVVFHNMYYENIRDRGVLGFQTPGLIVFYPITPKFMATLIDSNVYYGDYKKDDTFYSVVDHNDVSQINALQIHHCSKVLYYSNAIHKEYVIALYNKHRKLIQKPQSVLKVRRKWLIDNKVSGKPLYHMYEMLLNHRLELSFIKCNKVAAKDYSFRHRSPELVEFLEKLNKSSSFD